MSAPEPFTILFSLSLFLCSLGSLTGSSPPVCPPSSCGHLRDIHSPLRLAGDPEHCGRPENELVCEGNRAVLSFRSAKYYVLNITYDELETTINVVDVNLASGNCNLPSQSLPPGSFDGEENCSIDDYYYGCVAFVNCSREINNTMYTSVPCMSRSSTHVYLVREWHLEFLQPSCRPVSFVPLPYGASNALYSGAEAAVALQKGFDLRCRRRDRHSKAHTVEMCWREFLVIVRLALSMKDDDRVTPKRVRQLWGPIWYRFGFPEVRFYRCLRLNDFGTVMDSQVDKGFAVLLTTLVAALHLIIVLVLVRFIVGYLSISVLLIRKFQEEHASVDTLEKFLQNQKMLMPARYTYPEILSITNHFEKRLGQGGFGSVFQGKLPGDYSVAVKLLNDSRCDGEDFISEISTIGQIHHINVTRLIGFCSEGTKRALLYEYMPNGSLDKYISPSDGANSSLSWEKLHEIALGIARGIEYLHGGCEMCILHFDIKPHSILLDHNFTPKVSDFGLAKLYPKDYSLVSLSAARGTVGYIAPELISRNFGAISTKSDVYSFGMLLLEMAGARKNVNAVVGNSSEMYFPAWIYDRLCEQRALEQEIVAEIGEVEMKLCIVGLWCIQMKPSDRPSMNKVIEMLEGSTYALQMPPKPFFSSPCSISAITSCLDTSAEGLSAIPEV